MEKIASFPAASDSIGKKIVCGQLVIDIPEESLDPPRWPECCIYRVPNKLRKVKEEAYTPQLVSIGPFHHGQEQFRGMEIQKFRYLREFYNRTGKSYEDLSSIIDDQKEEQIRHCYSETIELSKKDFVNMVLLDSVFIVELFLRTFKREDHKEDYILSNPWFDWNIRQDFLLLENQLPFNFLQEFYKSAFNGNGEQEVDVPSFLDLSCSYFLPNNNRIPEEEVKHFTDLKRKSYCPPTFSFCRPTTFCCPPDLNPNPAGDLLFTATKLDEAGLVFKKASSRNLLHIHLPENKCSELFPCLNLSWLLACLPCLKSILCLEHMRRTLEVPQLVVDDRTEVLFRNLMALEQCHYPLDTYICNYVVLLDYLITTKADVVFLVEKGIVVNRLGSSAAVTTLINKLGLEIVEVNSCYQDLIDELNRYHENHWNRLMASLTSVYFRDFWRGSATFAGIFVLCVAFWNFLRPFVLDT